VPLALVILAAEEGHSKTPYYVAGIALAVFAVIISAIGIPRHETFPPSTAAARAVMGIAAILVIATMASAVLSA
jgi:hypothetical protein